MSVKSRPGRYGLIWTLALAVPALLVAGHALLTASPAQGEGDVNEATQTAVEEDAWARVEAAYAEMMERRGEGEVEDRNRRMREVADAAAAYLALGSDNLARVQHAARHVGNYFRILEDWTGAVAVWTDALERYPQPGVRVSFYDGRGRAYVALGQLSAAHADAQSLRALGRRAPAVQLAAQALAIDLDAAALEAVDGQPDLAAVSRLAAEASGYLIENAANSRLHLRPAYTLPRLIGRLGQPERLELTARLALRDAPVGGNLWSLMMQHRGTALVELGRDTEAREVIEQLTAGAREGDPQARRAIATIERALALAPGRPAPAFELADVHGERTYTLADFQGRIVLLDFWATWCGPCIQVMADHLQPLHEAYGERGLAVVSIGSPSRDTAERQAAFAGRHGYEWVKLFDASAAAIRAYHVTGLPTLVLIDREGRVVTHSSGAGAMPAIRAYLAEHLGAQER